MINRDSPALKDRTIERFEISFIRPLPSITNFSISFEFDHLRTVINKRLDSNSPSLTYSSIPTIFNRLILGRALEETIV